MGLVIIIVKIRVRVRDRIRDSERNKVWDRITVRENIYNKINC